jgi:hypothetical protein
MILPSFNAFAGTVQLGGIGAVTLTTAAPTGPTVSVLGASGATLDGLFVAATSTILLLRGPLVVTQDRVLSLTTATAASLASNSVVTVNGALVVSNYTLMSSSSVSGPGSLNLTGGTVQSSVALSTSSISMRRLS